MNTSVNIRSKEAGKNSRAQQADFCSTRKLLLANLALFALILFLLNSSALTTTGEEQQNGKDLVALKPATRSTALALTVEKKRQQPKEHTLLRADNSAAESKLSIPSLSSSSSSSFSSIESPIMVTTTDLILGMARNTDPKNFVVFCASLRETANSKANVVIWVNSPVNKRIR